MCRRTNHLRIRAAEPGYKVFSKLTQLSRESLDYGQCSQPLQPTLCINLLTGLSSTSVEASTTGMPIHPCFSQVSQAGFFGDSRSQDAAGASTLPTWAGNVPNVPIHILTECFFFSLGTYIHPLDLA
ncbi:hypothetical protein MBM_01139 [Drepanopeziza brunnea f. sp. 'multigermtubi' MB_m1]|uniref:Uncharacterized protein n=1 Tax=Marssonina brunnea f. sp. multigermtubi (strain MB_m1) TaxID=1072389 RepID=K1X5Q5_MARBU|nr:uncharacterized protein MBM_01139 [Drepanopeziza brunnea f. sp. 'multigermtubi' MB_m1]EKD20457.1 hypothetical protein MBM_01139 [Drepanopeziza brunnea f. sp. 'multigermtubi' MB_m1]